MSTLYLDVDSTLLVYPRLWPKPDSGLQQIRLPEATGVVGAFWNPKAIGLLRDFISRGDLTVVWCTAWGTQANEFLVEALDLPGPFEVANIRARFADAFEAGIWVKATAIFEHRQAAGYGDSDGFIFADDLPFGRFAVDYRRSISMLFDGIEHLNIAVDPKLGLTVSQVGKMAAWGRARN